MFRVGYQYTDFITMQLSSFNYNTALNSAGAVRSLFSSSSSSSSLFLTSLFPLSYVLLLSLDLRARALGHPLEQHHRLQQRPRGCWSGIAISFLSLFFNCCFIYLFIFVFVLYLFFLYIFDKKLHTKHTSRYPE